MDDRQQADSGLSDLQGSLAAIIPGARLEPTVLPGCRRLALHLLNADFPRDALAPEVMRRVMDNPLYWVFCWASGQVLAHWLLARPTLVANRRVLDFGCGSGVVGIAAKLAGAAQVIACDIDPLARAATRANAQLNGVELTLCEDFYAVAGPVDVILVADVLYDRANLVWLDRLAACADAVVIADSRVKDFTHPRFRQLAAQSSYTLPDLDESAEFRDVRIYGTGAAHALLAESPDTP
ncbi:MAG: 50S ribosomal protein L11 methyltransferase [Gammaproteobacteria bacterium]|nr:50S ribosomal protein L11 methyltransferase [Gammaproteobacteria bacterium]